ncbi:hypothetical protein ACIRP0_23335 [Streptomyces sp. NPDC101733]|uniref:hypothetical protein n=1 Tax=unclassified Streptomyces TaxID=2593676 RepID=UPI00383032E8
MSTKKYATSAIALLAALAATPPAHATGSVKEGTVRTVVIGQGLQVDEVIAAVDGRHRGLKARSALVRDGRRIRTLGEWKAAEYKEIADFKGEFVSWKIDRAFHHNDRICVVFEGLRERPCVTLREVRR